MEITYQEEKEIESESLLALYKNAGWNAYANDRDKLINAIKNSLCVLTARDQNKLVGLIRVVGDGVMIAYVQDVLVLQDYHRNKIGKTLLTKTLDKFKNVRRIVLLAEDNDEMRSFYEMFDFKSCDKGQLVAFTKLKNENVC
jgi:ribosomal protein S18 acetylase RimI-like enzyme